MPALAMPEWSIDINAQFAARLRDVQRHFAFGGFQALLRLRIDRLVGGHFDLIPVVAGYVNAARDIVQLQARRSGQGAPDRLLRVHTVGQRSSGRESYREFHWSCLS